MVDSVIQSLIQSPYVRTLASIPTKSEKLVHGIQDNVPPFSRRRVYVSPSLGQNTFGPFRFEIPRAGLLDQMSLRVRMKHNKGAVPGSLEEIYDNALYFSNCVDAIELYSKNRFIERVEGRAIHWENLLHTSSDESIYTGSYLDVDAFTNISPHTTPIALPDAVSNESARAYLSTYDEVQKEHWNGLFPEFHFPIPFACFSNMKKNFQTYFVENLSIVVSMRSDPFFHDTISAYNKYFMELTCDYHQYHPNVETVIRNANYKQGIPATLPWYDWIRFQHKLVDSDSVKTYNLESDALISEILIIPTVLKAALRIYQSYYVVITANSQVIHECTVGDAIGVLGSDRTVDGVSKTQSVKALSSPYSRCYIPIVFGLYRSHDHFSGGLSLANLTNPRIHIYPNRAVYLGLSPSINSVTQFIAALDFEIVAKRHYLLRVDSDTGVITRTIES